MEITQTIDRINRELSQTLLEYNTWFNEEIHVLQFKPHTGWSIEQILEHVTLTNHFLLILIRKGTSKAIELSRKTDLEEALKSYTPNLDQLDAIAQHQSFPWIRPEHMEPPGEMPLPEVKTLLAHQFDECKLALREMSHGEGILYQTTMTVNQLGKIDVYQYIYFLCQHAKRHLTQMQKVKEEYNRTHGNAQ
ncbi:DinB family protein [Paenibacillus wulumuqiensis]|uniref:DinB family protein n=1 Tax=Paenibacillus wulumuqiensis TaxID=1567107 RepID=UPI000619A8DF|nr:DinB family protein [Paenibacillus wulumuqiensis]